MSILNLATLATTSDLKNRNVLTDRSVKLSLITWLFREHFRFLGTHFSSPEYFFQLHVPMAATARRPSVVSKSDFQVGEGLLSVEQVQVSGLVGWAGASNTWGLYFKTLWIPFLRKRRNLRVNFLRNHFSLNYGKIIIFSRKCFMVLHSLNYLLFRKRALLNPFGLAN